MSIVVLFLAVFRLATAQSIPADSSDYFEAKVRPILATSCFGCHTNSALSGLRLDSLEAALKGDTDFREKLHSAA